jgi:hypothetical protein
MSVNSKFEQAQLVSYHLLLQETELMDLLPSGVYAVLGKLVQNAIISKEEVIAMAMGQRMHKVGFALHGSHFRQVEVPGKGMIAKSVLPVVEISPFSFLITSDGVLLEQAGIDSIEFGLTFSYPMLFSVGDKVEKTREKFSEATIFHGMRGWIRKETKLATFTYKGKCLKGSFRIGKLATFEAEERIKKIDGLKLLL